MVNLIKPFVALITVGRLLQQLRLWAQLAITKYARLISRSGQPRRISCGHQCNRFQQSFTHVPMLLMLHNCAQVLLMLKMLHFPPMLMMHNLKVSVTVQDSKSSHNTRGSAIWQGIAVPWASADYKRRSFQLFFSQTHGILLPKPQFYENFQNHVCSMSTAQSAHDIRLRKLFSYFTKSREEALEPWFQWVH